ncbi:MAG TPA: hypothetical protein VI548_01785 [Chitinophagaceae bacterium]|nr:hypothetical protein [Chitinophagaceae bacterium]
MKIDESILKVLLYFDMFDYPLTMEEIHQFIEQPVTREDLSTALTDCKSKNQVFQLDNFFSLHNNYSLAERRRTGNQKADILLNHAINISRRLYKFPYVRAIGVTGSVSKYFADEDADIDYFIITKANRLWMARTLMHLYKKLPFLKKRNKWYCMNYYVDEAVLQIEEKNIYTATELITLIPMQGVTDFIKFFDANKWANDYFPNYKFNHPVKEEPPVFYPLKMFFEFLFNNKLGNWLDDYFLKLTTRRWKLKEIQGRLNTKGENMGLKTSKHCSKPNPVFFHDQFLNKYRSRLKEEITRWNL